MTATRPDHMVLKALGEIAVVGADEDAVKEVTATDLKNHCAGRMDFTTCDAGGNRCISGHRDNFSIQLSIQQQPTKGADDEREAF